MQRRRQRARRGDQAAHQVVNAGAGALHDGGELRRRPLEGATGLRSPAVGAGPGRRQELRPQLPGLPPQMSREQRGQQPGDRLPLVGNGRPPGRDLRRVPRTARRAVLRQPLPLAEVGETDRVEQRDAGVPVPARQRAQQRLRLPQIAGVIGEPERRVAAHQGEPAGVRDDRHRPRRLPPGCRAPSGAPPGVCHDSPSTDRKLLVTHRSRRH